MPKKSALQHYVEFVIAAFFYYLGFTAIARLLQRRDNRSLIILNYHHASGNNLRKHLLYLRRHYRLLHLDEALEELYSPAQDRCARGNLRPAVVLTFDDGYYDNYSCAFPLALELQVPLTIFVVPAYIESGQPFWWFEGERLVAQARVDCVTLDDQVYHLANHRERQELIKAIHNHLWYATKRCECEAFLSSIRKALAIADVEIDYKYENRSIDWNEIQSMASTGYVSFGAHTMNHPILAYLSDQTEMEYEIGQCRAILEQRLAHPVRSFAYPYGRLDHISKESYEAVKRAGYDWAVTTLIGFNTPTTDPFLLRRISTDVSEHWLMVAARTSGIWHFIFG